ncbi:MAG: hypothetical protein Q9188_005937 [Gyalolechia gomerana]|nr:MAG: hypothetical protein LQ343_002239 [Gyalolechia ehrenbergii]
MDKLKDMAGKMGGSKGEEKPAGGAAGQEDYIDKGLAAAEKRGGMDPAKQREMNEGITDKGREMFEKSTG